LFIKFIYTSKRNSEIWERRSVPSPWLEVPVEVAMVESDCDCSGLLAVVAMAESDCA
jgi:hypothetical protein